jgi:16S rRNA (uracil1498-N3)-methyltransferase
MACLKGQAMDWLVEKLTELGVPRVQLLETDRCIAKPKLQTLERLQRISQQSLKQCGRTFEMQISPPKNLKDALRDAWKDPKNIWVALEPNAHGSTLSLSNLESSFRAPGSPELMIFVGPEGGWSEREITLMKSNSKLRFVDVSPQTLRAETAGILLAALLQSWSSTRESS